MNGDNKIIKVLTHQVAQAIAIIVGTVAVISYFAKPAAELDKKSIELDKRVTIVEKEHIDFKETYKEDVGEMKRNISATNNKIDTLTNLLINKQTKK